MKPLMWILHLSLMYTFIMMMIIMLYFFYFFMITKMYDTSNYLMNKWKWLW